MRTQSPAAAVDTPRFRRPRQSQAAPAVLEHAIQHAIAIVFDIDGRELRSPTRGTAEAAFARQVAMYLAHVSGGLSFTAIGRIFRRDRTTVAHACGLIEDRRDDVRVDRTLDLLEVVVDRLALVAGAARFN